MADHVEYAVDLPGEVLTDYYHDTSRVSLIRGPLGSAKTYTSCLKTMRIMTEQAPNEQGVRPSRFFAIRNTYSDLETTTIKDWLEVCGELGQFVASYPPVHRIRFQLQDETIVESEVIFLALDRPGAVKKLRGAQATGFWLNEVKELNKAVVDMADLRHGRYPSMVAGGVMPTWHGMFGDYNSPDEDHWLFRLAEEDRPQGWTFHVQPGGLFRQGEKFIPNPNAENLENLPEGYYVRGMEGKGKDWIKVNLCNEYGFVQDGKPVFPEYVDTVHAASEPIEPVPNVPIIVGIDFGLTPAALFMQKTPMRWQAIDEIVTEDMGAARFAELVSAKMRGEYSGFEFEVWGDPAGDQRAQTDEETPFMILRAAGIPAQPAPSNDFVLRREAMARPMTKLAMDGRPALLVSPRCRYFRKGLAGGYRYKRVQVAGDERYHDKPDKTIYSHVVEAGEYAMLGAGEGVSVITPHHPHGSQPVQVRHSFKVLG